MTTYHATRTQEMRTKTAGGGSRRTSLVLTRRGVDALADVCRGLFGGPGGQQAQKPAGMLDETAEIVISPRGRAGLAPAA